jgi:hypothetical protein
VSGRLEDMPGFRFRHPWRRHRRKAGREALVARFLALPISAAELNYREAKELERRAAARRRIGLLAKSGGKR